MLHGQIVKTGRPDTGITAQVDFVEIDKIKYVLKTDTPFNVSGERLFQLELSKLGLPYIRTFEHEALKPNQLLMERIYAETLITKQFTDDNLCMLGQMLSTVHSRVFPVYQQLDETGSLNNGSWDSFIYKLRGKALQSTYSSPIRQLAVQQATTLMLQQTVNRFVLCHGDLHPGNVFDKNSSLMIFDNNADAYVATPHYDLAIFFGELFTGYRYGNDLAQHVEDVSRMESFLSGYGHLPADFENFIDAYVVLRSLNRYPNKFIKHQDAVILAASLKVTRSI